MFTPSLSSGSLLIVKDLAQLGEHLRYLARRVPAYGSVGRALDDSPLTLLEVFPEVQKADLIEQRDAFYDLGMRGTALLSETSGTTGNGPLVTPRSMGELRWNSRNLSQAFEKHINRSLDRVAIMHPGLMSPFVEASTLALFQLGTPMLRIFPIEKICSYDRIVRVFRDYEISAIMTTPTLALKLLYERQRLPMERRRWSVRKILLTGEVLTMPLLHNVARLLEGDGRAFVYGSSEAATCAIGCSSGRYHPLLDDFAFELRPTPGVPAGAAELVVTWLNTGVRPLVRYRTGDLVAHGSDCPCGEQGIWLDVLGRSDASSGDFNTLRRRQLDELLFSQKAPVYHYQLILGKRNSRLVVVTEPHASEALSRELSTVLAQACRDILDLEAQVDVNPQGNEFYDFAPIPKCDRIIEEAV